MATKSGRSLLFATDESNTHEGEENGNAQNYNAVHPRILQKNQMTYRYRKRTLSSLAVQTKGGPRIVTADELAKQNKALC